MRSVGDRSFPVPAFDRLVGRGGLEIVDSVESARFELWTPNRVRPKGAETDAFAFPLDSAVTIETSKIEIPRLADVMIRDEGGAYLGQYSTATEREVVEAGRYNVELTTTPMKLYLLVESGMEIYRTGRTSVVVDFGSTVDVLVGARSFHERPGGTVTVTDDVEDVMDAVSLFGSALKTTSPERSFPTMRGHPPTIERGGEFRISKGIETPETGVELVIPRERRAVYAVSSLAYYLGAEVVPGRSPRLVADGSEYDLPRPTSKLGWDRDADEFERAVNRTLQQVFFLDCLTRTEGFYQFDLHEREAVESDLGLDLDFADLYDRPIPAQLETYLDLDYERLQPYFPTWNLLVDIVPTIQHVELLPYVVADLPLIRCPPPPEERTLRPLDDPALEFMDEKRRRAHRELHSKPGADDPEIHDMSFAGTPFTPVTGPGIEHAYAGDGYPRGANKLLQRGFENQLGEPRTDDSDIEIRVVVNDRPLARKELAYSVYGDKVLLDVDVSVDQKLTRGELREVLESPIDFLHFYGKATEEGLECENGYLDPWSVRDVNVKSFFLNTCNSYEHAKWLVSRGAYGGVATTSEIDDPDDALMMGRWMGRLLNQGFTLRSALRVVEQAYPDRMEYCILGDGGISLIQTESVQPNLAEISTAESGTYDVALELYPSSSKDVGASWRPNHSAEKVNHLTPNQLPERSMEKAQLDKFLDLQTIPTNFDGKYLWSDVVSYFKDY